MVFAACSRPAAGGITAEETQQRLLEGKRRLTRFDGAGARSAFVSLDTAHREQTGKPHCEASYGVVLADVQVILAKLNPFLLDYVQNQFTPLSARAAIHPASSADSDAGVGLETAWRELLPAITELVDYANAVTAIANCRFSIGLDEPAGEDFQFVANFLDNTKPVAQLALKTRFDGVEARLIAAAASLAVGLADFILAHDLTLVLDAEKTARQLGVDAACVRAHPLQCIGHPVDGHPSINLLDWAFVFHDNPNFLTQSDSRWKTYMPVADDRFADSLRPLRTLFPAMISRSIQLQREKADAPYVKSFTLVYDDKNTNSRLDSADTLGLNITDLILDCTALIGTVVPESEGIACRNRFDQYEVLAGTGILFLKSLASPGESIIGELQKFIDRVYENMTAVNQPSLKHELLPFGSFERMFTELLPVFDEPAPAFLAFDLTALFTSPKAVRYFVPIWQAGVGHTGARFLADSDDYQTDASPPVNTTLPLVFFDEAHGGLIWKIFDGTATPIYIPQSVVERDMFTCLPGEPCLPADCLNASNLFSELKGLDFINGTGDQLWNWPVMNGYLPDPALNGLVYIDGSVWGGIYDADAGNGSAAWQSAVCLLPAAGFVKATNASLQSSVWMLADFLLDHFRLAGLIGDFLK